MKTDEFITALKTHPDRNLRFAYMPGVFVASDYHITEVKQVRIDAVDCGANSTAWTETVIQLMEKQGGTEDPGMTARKALSILQKVNSAKPIPPGSEVKFEYGNPRFHTAQMIVEGIAIENDCLTVTLGIRPAVCKPSLDSGLPGQYRPGKAHPGRAKACC